MLGTAGASLGQWARFIDANDSDPALSINQRGSGRAFQTEINGSVTFYVDNNGDLLPGADSTYDIGATGAVLAEVWTDAIDSDGNIRLNGTGVDIGAPGTSAASAGDLSVAGVSTLEGDADIGGGVIQVDQGKGTVGIGTAASANRAIRTTMDFGEADSTVWGAVISPEVYETTGATANLVIGVRTLAQTGTSNTQNWTATVGLRGVSTRPGTLLGGSGTVTGGTGIFIENAVTIDSTVLTNAYGIYIEDLTTGTNDYGIYIQGADTYAIWVDAGLTRLDGQLEFEALQAAAAATNVSLDGNGQLQQDTSSERFKTVEGYWKGSGAGVLRRLHPSYGHWRKAMGWDGLDYWITAEDAYSALPEMAILDSERLPLSVRGPVVDAALVSGWQEHDSRLSVLEQAESVKDNYIRQLEARVEALERMLPEGA